jgi:hypothetical protein
MPCYSDRRCHSSQVVSERREGEDGHGEEVAPDFRRPDDLGDRLVSVLYRSTHRAPAQAPTNTPFLATMFQKIGLNAVMATKVHNEVLVVSKSSAPVL